jgi:hypothetical protein
MKHLVVSVYKDYSNKSRRVKIGPAPGVIDFPYMYIVNTEKKYCKNLKELELRYLA